MPARATAICIDWNTMPFVSIGRISVLAPTRRSLVLFPFYLLHHLVMSPMIARTTQSRPRDSVVVQKDLPWMDQSIHRDEPIQHSPQQSGSPNQNSRIVLARDAYSKSADSQSLVGSSIVSFRGTSNNNRVVTREPFGEGESLLFFASLVFFFGLQCTHPIISMARNPYRHRHGGH